MKPIRFERLPQDRAEVSELEMVLLAKEDGRKIVDAVFGTEWIEENWNALEGARVVFQTVTHPGTYIDPYPGILFDPPLSLGELLCVSVENYGSYSSGLLDRSEFPRVLKPNLDTSPLAVVMEHRFRRHLTDPLAMAVATAVFGDECMSKVPLMPDGTIIGTLEFFVVTEPGQPAKCDLDPPLARGEVIEVTLRTPPANARARQGVRGWKRPPSSQVACARYPRVVLPFDDCALARFLAEPAVDAANRLAKRSRPATNHESLTHPCCGLTKSGEEPTLHTIFWRARPRIGDYVVCLGCGGVLRFDAALLLVLPDPGEVDGVETLAFLNAREHRPG